MPNKDLLKIGLKNGRMLIQVPKGLKITPDYKPSFDTKVILAHALGNAIIGLVLKHLNPDSGFVKNLESNGMAIAHWHGYINPNVVPDGWQVYGEGNTPVSCSTSQSAIYALAGKIDSFIRYLPEKRNYSGDIQIEPHHGSNMCHLSLKDLADFLSHRDDVSRLGNYYLNHYHNKKVDELRFQ